MAQNKRVYSSPLFAEEKKSKIECTKMETTLICTEVNTKNGEKFLSAGFNVLDALVMWTQVFKYPQDLVFGIALIKTKDRGVGVNFKLKSGVSLDLMKFAKFEFTIAPDVYAGRIFTERGPPPALGELVTVSATGFGFHLSVEDIEKWLQLFGKVETRGQFLDHNLAPVKTDTVIVPMRLRKHIPSVLPAFGRKMQVYYHGQPKVCGSCFDVGHVRKDCANPRVEWMSYVKVIHQELAPLSMLGKWGEILARDPAYTSNGMETPAKQS